jgi:hypothetical protein
VTFEKGFDRIPSGEMTFEKGFDKIPSGEGCPQGGVCRSTDCPVVRCGLRPALPNPEPQMRKLA